MSLDWVIVTSYVPALVVSRVLIFQQLRRRPVASVTRNGAGA